MRSRLYFFLSCLGLLASAECRAITFGQVDTFQDATTANWQEGANTPNPPTNVPSGGPAGTGDAYLEDVSTGGFGAGSKMVMVNFVQWTGDYTAAGVNRITCQMANFGPETLAMRLTLQSGGGTIYSSTTAVTLPPDSVWTNVTFDLTTSTMALVAGSETLAQAMSHVTEARILSANAPDFRGTPVQATLGVDNITATSIPTAPSVTGAVSRKNHAGTNFDVALPLTGTPGVESRLGGPTSDYSMVVSFSSNVSVTGSPQAEVITGTGQIGSAGSGNGGMVTVSGNVVTVPLTGVTSQQTIQVRLNSVGGSSFTIPMGVLVGDASGDRFVNSGDATITRNRSGQSTDATNFRADYNEDGAINSADATLVRSRSGNFIP